MTGIQQQLNTHCRHQAQVVFPRERVRCGVTRADVNACQPLPNKTTALISLVQVFPYF